MRISLKERLQPDCVAASAKVTDAFESSRTQDRVCVCVCVPFSVARKRSTGRIFWFSLFENSLT